MADLKVKVGVDKSGFTTGLASMENSVKKFGTKVGGILAGAFAFGAVISTFKESIEKLDKVAKLSKTFDLSSESLQRLGGVAELSGGSMENVARALGKMSKAAFTASHDGGSLVSAFEAVGVSLDDLKNKGSEQLFLKIADGLKRIENPVERAGIGMQIFGKGFLTIAPMVAEGGAAIEKLASTMTIASEAAVLSAEKIDDAFTQLNLTVQGLMGTFAVAASPLIQFVATGIEQMLTFANSISMVVSAERELKNISSDISKDQDALKNKQTDRVIMGASDKELKNEFDKISVPDEVPDNSTAKQKELRKKISDEIERRKALKAIKRSDDEDMLGENLSSGSVNKTAEIEKNKLKSAEDKLADAIRDRETLSMNSAEKLGRAQAELVKLKMDELAIADKTIEKLNAQEGIERKKIEVLELQNDVNKEIQDAEKDFMRAAQRHDLDGMNEANQRKVRLEEQNKARGNAADFDPRAALIGKSDTADLTIRPTVEMPTLPEVDLTIRPTVEMPTLPEVDLTIRPTIEMPTLPEVDLTIRPTIEMPTIPDLTKMQPVAKQEFLGAQLRDIPTSTEAQRIQPVKLENPPNLQGIMDKLDRLIANAGVFS